jgi:flagellin
MSLRINTNVQAMNALRNLGITSENMGRTIERLSSGLRVNRASDDPAGLIISENMRAYIASLQQAMSNAQDATNLVKTAEAALDEVHTALRTMRQLAIHAANTGVNDVNAVLADQTQIRALIDSINRIADQTAFGNKKLLDGTSGIAAQVTDERYLSGIFIGSTFAGLSTASGSVNISVVTRAERALYTGTQAYTGVTSTIGTTGNVVINGQTVLISSSDSVQTFMDKINAVSNLTGVTAQFSVTAGTTGTIKLVQKNFGAQYRVQLNDTAGFIGPTGAAINNLGIDAAVNVQASTTSGMTIVPFTGGRATGDNGLRVTDMYGNILLLTEQANDAAATLSNVALINAGQLQFQVGPNSGQFVRFSLLDLHANQLGTTVASGKSLSTIDVTQQDRTDEALQIIDASISQVSKLRGDMGSFQRYVLESNIRSLNVAKENVTASESTIRDADFAAEVTTMTKHQILMQSGMSVLAQANQVPQQVLSLLR